MAETATEDGRLVGTVRKNAREVVRVTRREYEGHQLVDVRVWTVPPEGSGGEAKPSTKGLACRLETWRDLLPLLGAALAERGPAIDPGDALPRDHWGA